MRRHSMPKLVVPLPEDLCLHEAIERWTRARRIEELTSSDAATFESLHFPGELHGNALVRAPHRRRPAPLH